MKNENLTLLAPAKINLTLEVFGKRADGYHDLRSLVVPVSLYDTLTFTSREREIEVMCEVVGLPGEVLPLLPAPGDNLAARAARLLQEATGTSQGARIHIRKEIPVGGGMGGGECGCRWHVEGLEQPVGNGVVDRGPDGTGSPAGK
jgi:4-diphosphocytidyl-2-C-methyl-D-erythritol kinase